MRAKELPQDLRQPLTIAGWLADVVQRGLQIFGSGPVGVVARHFLSGRDGTFPLQ